MQREHYDPAFLNEAVLKSQATGDRGTALILQERARLLAPVEETAATAPAQPAAPADMLAPAVPGMPIWPQQR